MFEVRILGSGHALGNPIVGCGCERCARPHNKRTRASICVATEDVRVLIDTSPDLRQQMIENGLTSFTHVLYTHAHADHCHGIDDLRISRFNLDVERINVYSTAKVLEEVQHKFGYAFLPDDPVVGLLTANVLTAYEEFEIASGFTVLPYEQIHGKSHSVGYKIGRIAYSTDVNIMPEASMRALRGQVDLFIVDCIGYKPHGTHSHLAQSIEWAREIGAKCTILTHMGHSIDYAEIKSQLPADVLPGRDAMRIMYDPKSRNINILNA